MTPYSGYQLYLAERPKTRAEILAGDARLGRQAAAVFWQSRASWQGQHTGHHGRERDQGHSGPGHGTVWR